MRMHILVYFLTFINVTLSYNISYYGNNDVIHQKIYPDKVCVDCNYASRYEGLCHCDGKADKQKCLDHQMFCKKQCGVCLPDVYKTARTWSKCYDHKKSCKDYKNLGYCKKYEKWMKFYCKYSCGYCEECYDVDEDCPKWKEIGKCGQMSKFMLRNCKKSCGICDCHDHSIYCRIWASHYQCQINPMAMEKKCPFSCGLCEKLIPTAPILIVPELITTISSPLTSSTATSPTTSTKLSTVVETATLSMTNATTSSTTTTMAQNTTTKSSLTARPKKQKENKEKDIHTIKLTNIVINKTFPTTPSTLKRFSFPTAVISNSSRYSYKVNDKKCGLPPTKRYRRIVGGEELLPPGSWPWIVGITLLSHADRVDCGGSLVTSEFILTAAHCFARPGGMDPILYIIRLGEHHLGNDEGTERFVKIDQIFIHQLYNPNTYDYDIAIARLVNPVKISSKIKPACLIDNNQYLTPGKYCFVAGWGNKAEGQQGNGELKVARVPIASLDDCNLKYSLILETVTERMLCASGDGNADSCEVDF